EGAAGTTLASQGECRRSEGGGGCSPPPDEEPHHATLGVRFAYDRIPGQGPLGGLEAGLSAILSPRAFVAGCDLPFLDEELIRFLVEETPSGEALVPVSGGRLQPLHAVYPREAAGAAREALQAGEFAMAALLDRIVWRRVEEAVFSHLPGAARSFTNINTPEDLAEAERILGGEAVGPGPILAITAPANGSGKTTLACRILEAHPGLFAAAKVITVYQESRYCPRDGKECACRLLHGDWKIVEDENELAREGTDTGRLVRAGARKVLWGLARPGGHPALWKELSPRLPAGAPVLCEGSGIADVARPECLLFVFDPGVPRRRWKDGAEESLARADLVVVNRHAATRSVEANVRWLEERRRDSIVVGDLGRPIAEWPDDTLARRVEQCLATSPSCRST
ncbi:MAG: molybdenum cofactor guanylyltransferase, partial [Planctomycetes bacterium]|nr:molybdenum cofactor guanylyltransferase [Planctomycetota bacterium]